MNSVDARSIEIDDTLHEIERELHRRLDLSERIAIGFALDRFADRAVLFDREDKEEEPWR